MTNDLAPYEDYLFVQVEKIKTFNDLLTEKYHLTDIPYNVSGRAFPKIGEIINRNGQKISYRFHGAGATFWEEGLEVIFAISPNSKYKIRINVGDFYCFLKTYLTDYEEPVPLDDIMENFEERGIFIKRKPSELGHLHVNEVWFESKLSGSIFTGLFNRVADANPY
jgi:hypothetical protein